MKPSALGAPKPRTVKLGDDYYLPAKLTVKKGTKIHWVWNSDNADSHDVRLKSGPKGVKKFHSELAASDYSYSKKLTAPGTYRIAIRTAQDDAAATYAPRLTKADGVIDWSWPAVRVHNLIRGLHPWPHAFSFLRGRRLILIRSRAASSLPRSEDAGHAATEQPGTIIEASGERLVVATGAGPLQLLQIQAEGKRPMSAREFLAGHPLTAGDRFAAAP